MDAGRKEEATRDAAGWQRVGRSGSRQDTATQRAREKLQEYEWRPDM